MTNKENPVEPINLIKLPLTHGKKITFNYLGSCPICNDTCCDDMNYCSNCGQKLNWDNIRNSKGVTE